MTTFVGLGMNLDWTILPLLVLHLVNLTAVLPLTRLVITSQLSLLLPQRLLLGLSYRRLPYLAVLLRRHIRILLPLSQRPFSLSSPGYMIL